MNTFLDIVIGFFAERCESACDFFYPRGVVGGIGSVLMVIAAIPFLLFLFSVGCVVDGVKWVSK